VQRLCGEQGPIAISPRMTIALTAAGAHSRHRGTPCCATLVHVARARVDPDDSQLGHGSGGPRSAQFRFAAMTIAGIGHAALTGAVHGKAGSAAVQRFPLPGPDMAAETHGLVTGVRLRDESPARR
jgi:hypothetical protein